MGVDGVIEETVKDELLFIFRKLFERKKITLEEYNKAVKIIIKQYT